MAEAIIHLESSHTRLPAQTASDRETLQMLHKCADVTVKLQLCAADMSQLSDIMPHIEVMYCDVCSLSFFFLILSHSLCLSLDLFFH